ncbi:MAG: queuosine salvage family protein [Parcubacteria group bacterium]|jgi:hypothetical protein
MNKILETTKYVVENSKNVSIDHGEILEFCEYFKRGSAKHWWQDSPFDISDLEIENRLKFLLLFNAISFCYWAEPRWSQKTQSWYEPTWKIQFNKEKRNGAWGLITNLAKVLLNGRMKLDSRGWASMKREDLAGILNENGIEIPLFKERLRIVRELGEVLEDKFNGQVFNLINDSRGNALKLLNSVITNFPSFRDEEFYKGKKIYFYKRAQLLVADICNNFDFKVKNFEQFTACADYKIPQVLRRLKILKYSPELSRKVDQKALLPRGSEEEIEIRANTIWAVEYIKEELKGIIPNIKSIDINDYLWLEGQKKSPADLPYHRTITTAY